MELSAFIAFCSTLLAIAVLRPLSPHLQLLDVPTQRKQHVGAVPLIGGIAVCIGVLLSVTTSLPYHSTMMTLLCCGMAMVGTGLLVPYPENKVSVAVS